MRLYHFRKHMQLAWTQSRWMLQVAKIRLTGLIPIAMAYVSNRVKLAAELAKN